MLYVGFLRGSVFSLCMDLMLLSKSLAAGFPVGFIGSYCVKLEGSTRQGIAGCHMQTAGICHRSWRLFPAAHKQTIVTVLVTTAKAHVLYHVRQ
jgi:hypothetical protein